MPRIAASNALRTSVLFAVGDDSKRGPVAGVNGTAQTNFGKYSKPRRAYAFAQPKSKTNSPQECDLRYIGAAPISVPCSSRNAKCIACQPVFAVAQPVCSSASKNSWLTNGLPRVSSAFHSAAETADSESRMLSMFDSLPITCS